MGDAPRWVIMLSAWSNVFAGITLIISFTVYFIALQVEHCDPRKEDCDKYLANHGIIFNGFGFPDGGPDGHSWFLVAKWMMFAEGALWFLGGSLLSYRNVCNANAAGAVSQCIIATGGLFFTCSAFGSPANIISLRYVVPTTVFADPGSSGKTWVSFSDACPFFGITTFLIATSMGLYSVWGLPKNKLVSPFYGVLCFFIGAWVIGIITLFLPTLAGGLTRWEDLNPAPCMDLGPTGPPFDASKPCMLDMPSFAWYQLKIVAVIGAIFLEGGALIFGIMDNFLCLPAKDDKLLATDGLAA